MALTTTTLASAVAVTGRSILVTSATGFAAGNMIRVDNEVMVITKEYVTGTTIPVLRGFDGTAQVAHPVGANVTTGLVTDWPFPAAGGPPIVYDARPARDGISYTASGAITLPSAGRDMVATLNGTTILNMTVAAPTKEMDNSKLFVVGNGKAAHTVTFTGGLGLVGATADVATFKADQSQGLEVIACNGAWVPSAAVAGAATLAGVGLA